MTLDEKIAQAQRHVEIGRLVIECQRALILRHRTPASIDLLEPFEQTQRIFEMDLADLLKRPGGRTHAHFSATAKQADGT